MTQRSAVQNVAGKLSRRKTQRSATAEESFTGSSTGPGCSDRDAVHPETLSHHHDAEAALNIMASTKR